MEDVIIRKKSTTTRNILLVDDDPTCLAIVAAILRKLNCQVITVTNPNDALYTIRINGGDLDLVISDVHMPDMNGYQLQQTLAQEFNTLPVILMSADRSTSNCDASCVMFKPIKPEDLKEIVMRDVDTNANEMTASPTVTINRKRKLHSKSKLNEALDGKKGEISSSSSTKKPKLIWNNSLHNRFLEALRIIGLDRAVPKRILEVMNVPGLTRENVASHLQKYRIFLRRVTDASFKMKHCENLGNFSQPVIHRIGHFPAISPAIPETSSSSTQLGFGQQLSHAWTGHQTPTNNTHHSGDFSGDLRVCFSAPQITNPNPNPSFQFPFQDGHDISNNITPVSSSIFDNYVGNNNVKGVEKKQGLDCDGLLLLSPSRVDDENNGFSCSEKSGGGLLSDVVAGYGFCGNVSEPHYVVTIFADPNNPPIQASGGEAMSCYTTYEDGFSDLDKEKFVQSFHQPFSQVPEVQLGTCSVNHQLQNQQNEDELLQYFNLVAASCDENPTLAAI